MPLETIAVDLTPVLPGGENGGAKIFALELVRRLASLAPGTRFLLLTQARSHDELASLEGANVRRVLVSAGAAGGVRSSSFERAARILAPLPRSLRRLAAHLAYRLHRRLKRGAAARLRDARADLLFCPFTAPTYREPGVPTVCTVYDLQYRAHPEFFSVEDAVQRDLAFRDACRHATRLAAISEHSRESAIAHGCDASRIRTIYLRMAVPPAPPVDLRPALERLGLHANGYLLYPANFWKHKNHEALLEAFVLARSRGLDPSLALVLTGAPGGRRDAVAAKAREIGLGERVVFAGYLSRDELLAAMAASRALVFPSLYEGFGLAVVEAMALGVPVACSRATSLPEVAGEAALYFDPRDTGDIADALLRVSGDDGLRARLAQAGTRQAARFADPQRMAAEYWKLFEEAIAAGEKAR